MIKVLYHANCNDGFCAAWVLYRIYKDKAEYIPVKYGQDPPVFNPDDDVIIVDFSYKRDVLLGIKARVKSLLVLDHHKTAQAELEGLDFCKFDMSKSGAHITWEHYNPGSPLHSLVEYTEDRDLWLWQLPYSREINAALSLYEHDLELWNDYVSVKIVQSKDLLINEGQTILKYEEKLVKQHTENAVEYILDDFNILGVNATVLFSDIAGQLSQGRPFGFAYFIREDGKYQYSLRSDPNGVDVSEIAKRFDGGGHFHAAGFESFDFKFQK